MAIESVEASGGTATQLSTAQVLAPEVTAIGFRYFDGRVWQATWDTETIGRIPRAVEISFKLVEPRRKPAVFNVAVSRSMETFRTVILIPVSDPYPKEFVQ